MLIAISLLVKSQRGTLNKYPRKGDISKMLVPIPLKLGKPANKIHRWFGMFAKLTAGPGVFPGTSHSE